MITINSIIADIKSDLRSYDESGLIDDITLTLHLINELKRFGGNVMDIYPKVLEIRNSQAELPQNFFSLYKAVKTEPVGCNVEDDTLEEVIGGSTFYRIRKEASRTWDNLSHEFQDGEYTEVVEKVFIGTRKVDFYYKGNTLLKLVPGYDKSKINEKCENIKVVKCSHAISIIGNNIQTNFNKGFICIWFQGLRLNENDEIVLPEDPNARLYEFLMYSGKAKVFEGLWANNDDPNVQGKLQYFTQKAEIARTQASYQARFSSVTGANWWEGLRAKQQRRVRIFNI